MVMTNINHMKLLVIHIIDSLMVLPTGISWKLIVLKFG